MSSRANAMLLFNPVCVLAPIDDLNSWPTDQAKMNRRMGGDNASVLSPAHHVSKSSAPCVLFHGTADTSVPYATAEKFAENMNAAGARCKLVGYPLSTFLGGSSSLWDLRFGTGVYLETGACARFIHDWMTPIP